MGESALEVPTRRKYVVSGDLRDLMRRWAEPRGFVVPGKRFFFHMEDELTATLRGIFEKRGVDVQFIYFDRIMRALSTLIEDNEKSLPVISLDRVYVAPGSADAFFDTTRVVKYSKHGRNLDEQWLDLGHGPRSGAGSIAAQMERITRLQAVRDRKRVIVADDGIWSRKSLAGFEKLLARNGITIEKFLVAIWVKPDPSEPVKEEARLRAPVVTVPESEWNFRPGEVYDWVCARDFCPGAPFSGKTVGEPIDGESMRDEVMGGYYPGTPMEGNFGAPYMLPLGHVQDWASIPGDEVRDFSLFCLDQAIRLFREIEAETKRVLKESRTVRVADLDRPPYVYRNKRDSPIARELEESFEILKASPR